MSSQVRPSMPFVDLATQQARIREQVEKNIRAVLDHGQYIMGPEIGRLERRLAEAVGVIHAITCASGTDALLMALMAHGVGPGDAVLTTPFTFIATAEVIRLLGATPVFVDIRPDTWNIDPARIIDALEALATGDRSRHPLPAFPEGNPPRARGIIAVDLFGLPADYDLMPRRRDTGLFVIEDAAQSHGGTYFGRAAGGLADVGCTSFFPAKPLGGYGDGGAMFTNDDDLADVLRSIRNHGMGEDRYDNVRVGINGRLDSLQAAILLAKIEIFPQEAESRRSVARRYTRLLESLPDLTLPQIPPECESIWAQYSVLAKSGADRTFFQERLQAEGIPTAVYYPKPLHLQTAFQDLGYRPGDFPVSEDRASRIFSLPMHPYLTPEDQRRVTGCLERAVRERASFP